MASEAQQLQDVATPAPAAEPPSPSGERSTGFWLLLGLVALVALAVRLVNIYVVWPHFRIGGDAVYYVGQGQAIARGEWFVDPARSAFLHAQTPSAAHPPLYPLFLGGVDWIGFTSVTAARVASTVLGVVTVVVIGLAGRAAAGRRAGLIAAACAAVYPSFWINDTKIISETMAAFTVALVLLTAYSFWRSLGVATAAAMGLATGLAALSRGELFLIAPLVVLPLVLQRAGGWRRVGQLLGSAAVAMVVVVGPWVGFNLARFEKPEFITTESGSTLSAGSCDIVTSGSHIGQWTTCRRLKGVEGDESVLDRAFRKDAIDYWRHHLDRLPATVAARVGRLWDVYRPLQNLQFDTKLEHRGKAPSEMNMVAYYGLLPFGVAGLVLLRRRRVPIWPLLAIAVTSTLAAAIFWGGTRLRSPIDVALVVAAGAGIDGLLGLLSRRGRTVGSGDASPRAAELQH